ncbi:fatty-acid amide hydrolase 2, partial [Nephila pilipes]
MKEGFQMLWAKFAEVGCLPMEAGLAYGKKSINVWWELFKSNFRLSNHTLPLLLLSAVGLPKEDKNYYDTLENYKSLQKKFEDIFQGDAILLLPTHPEPAP